MNCYIRRDFTAISYLQLLHVYPHISDQVKKKLRSPLDNLADME